MLKVIKRFVIGFTVIILQTVSLFLILCGVGALESTKGIEFILFVAPTTYITLTGFFFLHRVKC